VLIRTALSVVLTLCPPGHPTKDIDAQILVLDLDVDLFRFRKHATVAPSVILPCCSVTHALHAVHADS